MKFTIKSSFKNLTFSIFDRKFKAELEKLSVELAEEFRKTLIDNIRTNKFGLEVSQETLRKRRNEGITSTVPLLATSDYINAIVAQATKVTLKRGIHKPSGLTYSQLATILEYGRMDKSIPAFPVWRKTYEEFQPILEKRLSNLIRKNLTSKQSQNESTDNGKNQEESQKKSNNRKRF